MLLEDFAPTSLAPVPVADRYDEGYRQGWDDAAAELKADDLRLGARLAACLETASHTQAEAVALCLDRLEPLLAEMFDKLLPRAAERAFLPLILEEAETLLRDARGAALALHVAPEAVGPLQAFLGDARLERLRIEGEVGLAPLQARFVHPEGERELDLGRLLDALDDAYDALRPTEETDDDR